MYHLYFPVSMNCYLFLGKNLIYNADFCRDVVGQVQMKLNARLWSSTTLVFVFFYDYSYVGLFPS